MLTEGQILDQKYKIGRLLGTGGMGSVFEAEHLRIKRLVAIKTLHKETADAENLKRFEREAEAAGRIGSEHIVEVLDFGTTPDGERFMVMELMNGEPLKARLQRGRLPPAEVVPIIAQVLRGIAAAHDAGIVHRDLKPDNIYVLREKAGQKDFVKILDFGISKFSALSSESGQMTKTGAVMGTPFYMSPEQARSANDVDARSDLYAIGVIMYEAVTGAKPFSGTTLTELIFKIAFEDPPHPCTVVPTLDASFAQIVLKTMAREQADRYQSAAELTAALLAWQRGERIAHSPQPRNRTAEMVLPVGSAAAASPGQAGPFSAAPTRPHPQTQHSPLTPASPPQFAPVGPPVRPQPPTMMSAAPSHDTQRTWNQAHAWNQPQVSNQPPGEPRKSGARAYVVAGIVALGLCGAAVIVATRPSAPVSEASKAQPEPASATVSEATASAVVASTADASPNPQPAAPPQASSASAAVGPADAKPASAVTSSPKPNGLPVATLTQKPTGRAPSSSTPPPSKTVGDLGY